MSPNPLTNDRLATHGNIITVNFLTNDNAREQSTGINHQSFLALQCKLLCLYWKYFFHVSKILYNEIKVDILKRQCPEPRIFDTVDSLWQRQHFCPEIV